MIATANDLQRPIRKAVFDAAAPALEPSTYFLGFDTPYEYWHHGQRFSRDGRWLVFFAEYLEGPQADSGSEIYLWEIGRPPDTALRITHHTGNDQWPDLWIEP